MGLKSYAYSFLKWMLALAFVFAIYMFIQVVVAGFGGTVIGVIAAMASGSESFMEGAALDNAILMLGVAAQLVVIAVFLPWWRCMRPASFVARREAVATNDVSFAKSLALLLVIGVSAQFFVGGILEIVELLSPEAMAEYSEFMEDTSVGVFAIVSALSIAVLAPINEEIVCRGVMFEYAMRAMSPGWNVTDGARYRAVSARAFWIANTLQALAFGVLHMNLIQGGYAFVLGAVLGWVFWRTGKLRYPIILHFAMNASSYLVEPLYPLLSAVPTGLVIVFAAVMFALGIRGFGRLWISSDVLDSIERPQDVAAVQGILPVEGEVGDRPTPPDGYLG
ncbi:CAAX protease self-immunity [Collinsella intestinalis]|nr:CAAX protease self-immunity [Collinsella intestinalis]